MVTVKISAVKLYLVSQNLKIGGGAVVAGLLGNLLLDEVFLVKLKAPVN